jgi:signal transduction histidine kinase
VEARGREGLRAGRRQSWPAIHLDTLPRLFQPFARAADRADRDGLGPGLYIAAEIARAHDARLEVSSTPEETRFSFHMDRRDG